MVFIESLKEWKVQQRRKRTVKQMERRRQAMCDTRTLFDVNETKEDEK